MLQYVRLIILLPVISYIVACWEKPKSDEKTKLQIQLSCLYFVNWLTKLKGIFDIGL